MKINRVRYKYKRNLISKATFIEDMNEIHESLFSYQEILEENEISQIRITEDGVFFYHRDLDIRFTVPEGESRTAPIESLNFNSYEKNETLILKYLSCQTKCFIDIGANIGWYSIILPIIQPSLVCYAFEPLDIFYNSLVKNINLNNLNDRVKGIKIALSDKQGTGHIQYVPKNGTNASLRNVANKKNVILNDVEMITLDSWCDLNNIKPDLVKCDVEGAELLVLNGARNLISKGETIFFIELLRKWSFAFGYNSNSVIELFKKNGYCAIAISNKNYIINEITDSTVETNFIFIPNKSKQTINNILSING